MTAGTTSIQTGLTESRELTVALAGNPNVGKTTLFNALTGLKQKVANYPGVTVEKKVGRCELGERHKGTEAQRHKGAARECLIIDLPGTYSLASRSPDEHVARQVVLGQIEGTPRPDVIVVVADASNLERNLYLVTQVLELGRPTVVALTMGDIAEEQGRRVDAKVLAARLHVPVVAVQAPKGIGVDELKRAIAAAGEGAIITPLDLRLPEVMQTHVDKLRVILTEEKLSPADQAEFDAHLMLSMGEDEEAADPRRKHPRVSAALSAAMVECEQADVDPIGAEIEAHYAYIGEIVGDCVGAVAGHREKVSRTDRLDRVLTHKVWGMGIFVGMMALMFVTIFWLAKPIMEFLQKTAVGGLGDWIAGRMDEGPLRSLIVDGVIAGVGNVVVFLPQIALLFLFLALLEDSGYMSRAAFLMDRVMSKVGLHGKSFIPLLSGYACAVPAIMGTRVIENRRDRLATILVLPLMSCSARLPVYLLLIGVIGATMGGGAWLSAGLLLAMYALGTLTAFGMAWLFKRTLLKGPAPAFILEMPPYRLPHWKVVLTTVGQRCWAFLKRAGTLIFAFSVIMWAGTHYPKPATYTKDYEGLTKAVEERSGAVETKLKALGWTEPGEPSAAVALSAEQVVERDALLATRKDLQDEKEDLSNAKGGEVLEHSVAGKVGHAIAPVFYPLGFDWKTSIGVTGAFFAREIVISTMGIVYSVGEVESDEPEPLKKAMLKDTWPEGSARAGQKVWTPLVAISLMVFVVFCMQCLSTLAVAKREMGHWGWPAFMFVYMTGLAYVAALAVYQVGTVLKIGVQ